MNIELEHWEKRKVLWNIESGHHQTSRDEREITKLLRQTRKLLKPKLYSRNLLKEINTWAVPPCKILGTIFKMDKRSEINRPEDKKVDIYAQRVTPE